MSPGRHRWHGQNKTSGSSVPPCRQHKRGRQCQPNAMVAVRMKLHKNYHIGLTKVLLSTTGGAIVTLVTAWLEPAIGVIGLRVPTSLTELQTKNIRSKYGDGGSVVGKMYSGVCSEAWALTYYDVDATAMLNDEYPINDTTAIPTWVEIRSDKSDWITCTFASGFPFASLKWSFNEDDSVDAGAIRLTGKRGTPDGDVLPCHIIYCGFVSNTILYSIMVLFVLRIHSNRSHRPAAGTTACAARARR